MPGIIYTRPGLSIYIILICGRFAELFDKFNVFCILTEPGMESIIGHIIYVVKSDLLAEKLFMIVPFPFVPLFNCNNFAFKHKLWNLDRSSLLIFIFLSRTKRGHRVSCRLNLDSPA